ncbi:tryptophan--tRNA ligase [Candidatus Nomurabacteria bacterium]|uniref:Tryptophan--tRNA ligase n=1 Tax=candidate division WWE3 bacterium TaxID=2053526 RepID=A0A955DZJ4_UNCKA|nr:tryptophan--tRNA ligase [candidate division WWE3 bacterium]MCB9823553.1 tryptophan--tRNA ligase [Candidatus Nomurabacteria bacterium]MCB9827348.1 tryptophan--tRNA ligase [Candidatus Nomurabacteria bacterium]HXK52504.1 tryptophan--tRNA ligase [bacterium]
MSGVFDTKKHKKRILTGDTPTGRLHLGHYIGTLENRVKLQHEYETFIILADTHAFAYPKYIDDPVYIAKATIDITIANLAVGLNPESTTFFVESGIPEIYELATFFSMLVSHNRALRNPTIKDEIKMKSLGDSYSLGFIFFPLLQVADIIGVKADLVPVGIDQKPHVEQALEVVSRFNSMYGEVFPVPKALIGRVGKLVGTDGNPKMGKSLNNCVFLNDSEEDLKSKIMNMFTDPARIHASDPGRVEGNPVFIYHDAFNPNKDEILDLKDRYVKGQVGDVEVKTKLFNALNTFLGPIRDRYKYYDERREDVKDILIQGTARTREVVRETLEETKDKMHLLNSL